MPSELHAEAESVPSVVRQLVVLDGRTFALSDEAGDMRREVHGLVHDDRRHLSRLEVSVDDASLEVLASSTPTPLSAVVVARVRGLQEGAGPAVLIRRRWVAGGLREDLHLRNTSERAQRWTLRVGLAADFAHLFDVKAGRHGDARRLEPSEGGLRIIAADGAHATAVTARPGPTSADLEESCLSWRLDVPAREERAVCLTVEPVVDGRSAGLAFPCGLEPAEAIPVRRLEQWHANVPSVGSEDGRLPVVVDQALVDLASLRIVDRAHPDRTVIAAGAPWFMTLFGRDSLLTSWMVLPFDDALASGVLWSLADLQGTVDDPVAEEQPGRILHELRRHGGGGPFIARERYYGTVDATPLFVMLAAEAWRWGALGPADLAGLGPAVDAALDWVLGPGDSDGDGFVDYHRRDPAGLANQGWKDSWDGVTFADGGQPRGPIALAEVQGYVHAALVGAADLAEPMGLRHPAEDLQAAAARLRARFDDAFWDERGWYAMALDGAGRRVDALTTNPGHALWAGIAAPEHADRYLDRVMDADMWTGWGLRTLAAEMGAYDPLSYHNGSVWPHDTAICAAGAARYGRWDVVDRIVDGALDAAMHFAGRPPELFSGISRADAPMPVAYPASCSPQAWSSASVLLLLRALLDLRPAEGGAVLAVHRNDLSGVADLQIDGLRGGGHRHLLEVRDEAATVSRTGPERV
ncbi:MAG: glycogen debranching N-terminal domain-containing protein [Acidimicrobiales bacterium]